jgi:cytochrome P450
MSAGSEAAFPPPRDPARPLDPPPELLRRLREEPISRIKIWDGSEPWLITRYEDGRAVLTDERFSVNPWRPGFPEKNVAYANTLGHDRNIRAIDNPEHDIQKRMMIRDFTVKRVEEIRPKIQRLVDELIDDMLAKGPPVDLIPALALPVPTMVICELLGVAYDERERFETLTKLCLASHDGAQAKQAGLAMNDLIEELIDAKLESPGNDLISRLVHEQMLPGNLDRSLVVSLGRLILIAGHETTAGMIALSTIAVLEHPRAHRLLLERHDRDFVVNAVDEMFRFLSITHAGRRRVAIEDVEIGGELIRANEGVIVLNNLMDRDETVFVNPGVLDLERENARANVAFGYGIHQCPGQLLSRVEMQVVHATLWRRIPTLRLARPISELDFHEHGSNFEVSEVEVTW